MLIIKEIEKNSIGEEIGLKIGDKILSFDGKDAIDIFDYFHFNFKKESFVLTVEQEDGVFSCEIEKDLDETLGLTFESDNLEIKTCQNNCIFCFVDQMPKGLRPSLYVKDDDYRQSYLCGNFVTLTNVKDSELDRICEYNLSPIYVSVQATSGEVRKMMLNNRFADKILPQLQKLSNAGIEIHTQIVLVKGVNDNEILQKSLEDLSKIKGVLSVAVVPCGVTKFREGLFKVNEFSKDDAKKVLKTIKDFNEKLGKTLVFASDEFYLKAELEVENYSHYGDFSQIENGVGMIAKFKHDFLKACRKSTYRRTFLAVTGELAYNFIKKCAQICQENVEGLKIEVEKIENEFFGKEVTCAGLIVGQDILKFVLNYKKEFDALLIPQNMLRAGEDVFLDGMSVLELSKKINKPIRIVGEGGEEFFLAVTGEENE